MIFLSSHQKVAVGSCTNHSPIKSNSLFFIIRRALSASFIKRKSPCFTADRRVLLRPSAASWRPSPPRSVSASRPPIGKYKISHQLGSGCLAFVIGGGSCRSRDYLLPPLSYLPHCSSATPPLHHRCLFD